MPTPGEQLNQAIAAVTRMAGDMTALGESLRQLRQDHLRLQARVDALDGKPPQSGSNPPPPPVTPGKRIQWSTAKGTDNDGDGLTITKPGRYSWLGWDGWNQNVVVRCDGDVVFEDCAFIRALRDDPNAPHPGQGLYVEKARSVTAVRCLFAYNGWRADKPHTRTQFRHGWYHNLEGGKAYAEDCLFAANANAGMQTRTSAETVRCMFVGNGIGLIHVKGEHTSRDCWWYDGDHYCERNPAPDASIKAWTGNTAIQTYDKLNLLNARIRSREGQGLPKAQETSNMGAVNLAHGHRDNPGVTGSIVATGCTLSAWPGGNFTGAKIHDGSGFNLVPGISNYEWRQDVDAVIAGLSVVEAIKRIREGAFK